MYKHKLLSVALFRVFCPTGILLRYGQSKQAEAFTYWIIMSHYFFALMQV